MSDENDPKAAAQAALYDAMETGAAPASHSRWRHYKGGTYVVLACAVTEATLEPVVVYQSERRGYVWTRPLSQWREAVQRGLSRFAPISRRAPVAP